MPKKDFSQAEPEEVDKVIELLFDKSGPIPEGQRCENDEHEERLEEADILAPSTAYLAEETDDDTLELQPGYDESVHLAEVKCFTTGEESVCYSYFCETCGESLSEMDEYVYDAEMPVNDSGEPILVHCE